MAKSIPLHPLTLPVISSYAFLASGQEDQLGLVKHHCIWQKVLYTHGRHESSMAQSSIADEHFALPTILLICPVRY